MEMDYSISERVGLDQMMSRGPLDSNMLPGIKQHVSVETNSSVFWNKKSIHITLPHLSLFSSILH